MKTRLYYLLVLLCMLFAAGCKNGPASSTVMKTDGATDGCEGEKAKAILWVDYKPGRKLTDGTTIRTAKVRAEVHADGSVKILSFCKAQPLKVKNYLLKRIEVYRIKERMFEGNHIQPGEQYLQLRYLPDEIK